VNDTAAGTGAQVITLQGLDENGNSIEEDINMNGTTVTTETTNTFKRLNRAFVKEAGTYAGSNFGEIDIEIDGTATLIAQITGLETVNTANYGLGQTQRGMYTVPLGFSGYITRIDVSVSSTKPGSIILYRQDNILATSAPFGSRRILWLADDVEGASSTTFSSYLKVPELCDVWFRALGGAANTALDASFDIILIQD